jgi:uncharacterized protein
VPPAPASLGYGGRVSIALAAIGVAVGAALQSATGFGFSLISAPILFAVVGPLEAVGALTIVSVLTNLLTLGTEGRRPVPARHELAVLLGCAVPGALVGVAVLRALSATALQIALTVGVLLTLAVRWWTGRRRATAEEAVPHGPRWAGPVAGFAAGALTTSTTTSGPPLITYLLGRGLEPAAFRDTLSVCFLALGPIAAAALLVTGTTGAIPRLGLMAALVPATAIGQVAGRPMFARLAGGGRYEPVVTAVLLISVVAGLVGTFTS